MVLPEEQTEALIEAYEEHMCLWQKSHVHYANKHKKESAYEAIAEKVNLPKDVVKEKIHSLRTVYFQNATKARKIKSGSAGGKQVVKWKYFSKLNFLSGEVAECGKTDILQVKFY